jgi:hypothetical protein
MTRGPPMEDHDIFSSLQAHTWRCMHDNWATPDLMLALVKGISHVATQNWTQNMFNLVRLCGYVYIDEHILLPLFIWVAGWPQHEQQEGGGRGGGSMAACRTRFMVVLPEPALWGHGG